jgi:hypothetical protein
MRPKRPNRFGVGQAGPGFKMDAPGPGRVIVDRPQVIAPYLSRCCGVATKFVARRGERDLRRCGQCGQEDIY